MRGQVVSRRFGWDCHGLPAEVEAEKELGIAGHPEITAFGIAEFNDACRTSVLRYTDEWERYVDRQARWVDFDNDYKTLDLDYMESVMWAFKSLWDKGLIYEGFRVLAYCWRCETPLSNTETRMDDVYRDRQDPALTVGFELVDGPLGRRPGAGLDDDAVDAAGQPRPRRRPRRRLRRRRARRRPVRARRRAGSAPTPPSSATAEPVGHRARRRARRARYRPLFDFFADAERFGTERAFQVLGADFVSTEDGTGIVHLAPGLRRGRPGGLQRRRHPDDRADGRARPLHRRGRRRGPASTSSTPTRTSSATSRTPASCCATRPTTTRYPHCWRCAQPLVYRAISSWFVEVTKFRDRMVELNEEITWVPEHLKHGSFGKWLENARDWSISRNRFWGSPIPVWRSDDPAYPRVDVYGSLAELEADFGVAVTDLHRPAVDELVRPNPDDPTGPLDDAARARGARLLVRVGLDAVRPGALPVREPGVVRGATTRATSSSSTSARPAAGSTRCTCWPRRCSTGRRSAPASATASCSATTG